MTQKAQKSHKSERRPAYSASRPNAPISASGAGAIHSANHRRSRWLGLFSGGNSTPGAHATRRAGHTTQKPNMMFIAGLDFFGGGIITLVGISSINRSGLGDLMGPLFVALGITIFISALLMLQYRMLGIQIGMVTWGLVAIQGVLSLLGGNVAAFINVAAAGGIEYMLYIYATQEPLNHFFS